MSVNPSPAIRVNGLKKTYRSVLPWARREVHAVSDLSLTVPRGELFGLLGPNGAGKTTTIKIIAGLVVPDAGKVEFPSFERRPRIGAVLEGSRNLYWRLSAWENIRYFGEIKGVPMSLLRKQADELLELFSLSERRNSPAQTLSRGMQQKLAVVLSLLGEPEVLLLDEPTLGLDVASSLIIQKQLKQLCRDRGLTIIITTHQMDVAQSLCRRVGIVRDGRVIASEMVSDLVDHFKRQDYLVRIGEDDWNRIRDRLSAFEYEEEEEERPNQVRIRFKFSAEATFYSLMGILSAGEIHLHDLRQEIPTLEDVFISLTEGDGTAHGGGGL